MARAVLYQGDCINILPSIPDGSVDMILADLPYGTTRNKWDSVIDLEELWKQYKRVTKPSAAIILFAQSPFDKSLAMSNFPLYRYEWIWEKTSATGFLNAKRMPMKAHENLLVFYQRLPTYNPQKTINHVRKVSTAHHKRNSKRTTNYNEHGLTTYDSTERYPRDVLRFPNDRQKSAIHSTQKPVALCEYMVRTYTNPGETVLDNVFGSGSVILGALNEGRNAIGIEKDEEYFSAAAERITSAYPNMVELRY